MDSVANIDSFEVLKQAAVELETDLRDAQQQLLEKDRLLAAQGNSYMELSMGEARDLFLDKLQDDTVTEHRFVQAVAGDTHEEVYRTLLKDYMDNGGGFALYDKFYGKFLSAANKMMEAARKAVGEARA